MTKIKRNLTTGFDTTQAMSHRCIVCGRIVLVKNIRQRSESSKMGMCEKHYDMRHVLTLTHNYYTKTFDKGVQQ